MTADTYVSFYYLAVAWALSFILLMAWAMHVYLISNFDTMWPLKVLRAMGNVSSTFAFIPLLGLLSSGFSCGKSNPL